MLLNTGGKMDRYPFQQQWTWPNPGSLSLLCQSAVIYSSGKPFSLVRFCLCGAGTGCISPAPASQTLLVGPRLPTASLRELYCSSSTATLTDILALFSSLLVQQVTLCERTKCVLKAAWGEGEGGGGRHDPKEKRQRAKEVWWNACSVSEQESSCTHLKLPSYSTAFLAFFSRSFDFSGAAFPSAAIHNLPLKKC